MINGIERFNKLIDSTVMHALHVYAQLALLLLSVN